MRSLVGERPAYSRAERVSDAVVHVVGVSFALVAVPVVVALAVLWRGDSGTVLAACVYGATMLAMLTCSAVYNITHGCAWSGLLRRLDHTAIYLKIAGTYTPFAVLTGAEAGPLLTGLWTAAAVGAALKIFAPHRFKFLTVLLCLGMGWAGLAVGDEIIARLSPDVYALMLTGGLLYTAGVVFYLWAALPFHYTIWHVFVLAATGIFYAAVIVQLGHAAVDLPGAEAAGIFPLRFVAGAG